MNKAEEALENIKSKQYANIVESEGNIIYYCFQFGKDDKNINLLEPIVRKFGDIPDSIKVSEIRQKLEDIFDFGFDVETSPDGTTIISNINKNDDIFYVGIEENKIVEISIGGTDQKLDWLYKLWLNGTKIIAEGKK